MNTDKKLETLLDLVKHPEKYSEEQISEMLSDKESREYYDILVEARQAMAAGKDDNEVAVPDVGEEWNRFAEMQGMRIHSHWQGWHGWSIRKNVAVACIGILLISGLSFATVRVVNNNRKADAVEETTVDDKEAVEAEETVVEKEKTDTVSAKPIVYDNVELQTIMEDVSAKYGVSVVYNSDKAKHIRLYLNLDSDMTIDDVVEMLGHFENFRVSRLDETITIE
ncbi:MAG: DUF4974 domain-containing protein [Prevotella sp.]|nr:DUF4974 domain-containing protein [Prevotella sp.]